MKCVKCGKTAEVEGFCKECYLDRNPLLKPLKEIRILACSNCRKLLSKGSWGSFTDFNTGLKSIIRSKLKHNIPARFVELKLHLKDVKFKPGIKTKGSVSITVNTKIKETIVEQTYEIPLIIEFTACRPCSKLGTQYFEGVLQIRNPDDKVMEFVENELAKRTDLNIAKTVKLKNGIDFYLSSNTFIKRFAQKIYSKFGGEVKTNRKIFTRNKQTSRNVYRFNVLVRLPDFKKGDIVKVKRQLILIKNIKASVINGTDIMTFKPTSFDYRKNEFEIVCRKDDIKKTTVSRKWPHLEIIHPETYQSVTVKNKADVQPGQNVKVADIDGYIYLIT